MTDKVCETQKYKKLIIDQWIWLKIKKLEKNVQLTEKKITTKKKTLKQFVTHETANDKRKFSGAVA